MSSTSPNNRLPVLALVSLSALGVTSVPAFIEIANKATLWEYLLLVPLYVLVAGCFAVLALAWQQKQAELAALVLTWLSILGYWKKKWYLELIPKQYEFFDKQGLSTWSASPLYLNDLFVPVKLIAQAPHRISANPTGAIPDPLGASQPIWYYLQSNQRHHQRLALISPCGAGKTALLQHITLMLAVSRKKRRQLKLPNKLPVLLFLRDHINAVRANPDLPLPKLLYELHTKRGGTLSLAWFTYQFTKGRCLIMFDGLDELIDPDIHLAMAQWVEQQMGIYFRNRFIVTARPFGYPGNLDGTVTVLRICPFTPEQIATFLHNWYNAPQHEITKNRPSGLESSVGEQALLKGLKGPSDLSCLANNPLLLTLITDFYDDGNALPDQMDKLYMEICKVLLVKRWEARGLPPELTLDEMLSVLHPLAQHMRGMRLQEIISGEALSVIETSLKRVPWKKSGEDFLQMIQDRSGLVEHRNGYYRFMQPGLQRFLAASTRTQL